MWIIVGKILAMENSRVENGGAGNSRGPGRDVVGIAVSKSKIKDEEDISRGGKGQQKNG